MAYTTLDLTLISAQDLKNVNLFTKMEVYAVVSISGDPRTRQRTAPDRDGGRNPNWKAGILRFIVPSEGPGFLHILLRSRRILGDRAVGEVRVPLHELLGEPGNAAATPKFLSYQVRRLTSGKPKGVLNFSYKLAAAAVNHYEPVTAYPVAGGYPPPYPPMYGGYGAPPPPAGYGFPAAGYGAPVVQQPVSKNNFGMGMGAGLVGGALGGLLIGDMISDAVAYDAGFGDAGDGFGF